MTIIFFFFLNISAKFWPPPCPFTENPILADTFPKNRFFFQLYLNAYKNGLKHMIWINHNFAIKWVLLCFNLLWIFYGLNKKNTYFVFYWRLPLEGLERDQLSIIQGYTFYQPIRSNYKKKIFERPIYIHTYNTQI